MYSTTTKRLLCATSLRWRWNMKDRELSVTKFRHYVTSAVPTSHGLEKGYVAEKDGLQYYIVSRAYEELRICKFTSPWSKRVSMRNWLLHQLEDGRLSELRRNVSPTWQWTVSLGMECERFPDGKETIFQRTREVVINKEEEKVLHRRLKMEPCNAETANRAWATQWSGFCTVVMETGSDIWENGDGMRRVHLTRMEASYLTKPNEDRTKTLESQR